MYFTPWYESGGGIFALLLGGAWAVIVIIATIVVLRAGLRYLSNNPRRKLSEVNMARVTARNNYALSLIASQAQGRAFSEAEARFLEDWRTGSTL